MARSLWPASWIPTLLLVVLCLLAWETFWRSQGFRPSLADDAALWSLSRKQASERGTRAVALVGSSRMQMDLHRETFASFTGWRPAIQLALVRGPSVPVLRHLAADPSFRGVVLCEVNPSLFFTHTPGFEAEIERYVDVYESFGWSDELEQRLAMLAQGHLVTRLSRLQPIVIRNAIITRRLPTPRYSGVIGADRFRYADYRYVPNIAALHERISRELAGPDPETLTPERFEARIRDVERDADAIRARGGLVIFVRLPSSLMVLEREQRLWPRERWWDVFARLSESPTLHYADHPPLAEIVPPDGDHLGGRQAVHFAKRLGAILVDRGIAPGDGAGS